MKSVGLVVLFFSASFAITTRVGLDLSEAQIEFMVNEMLSEPMKQDVYRVQVLTAQLKEVEGQIKKLISMYHSLPNDDATMSKEQQDLYQQLSELTQKRDALKKNIQMTQFPISREKESNRKIILGNW